MQKSYLKVNPVKLNIYLLTTILAGIFITIIIIRNIPARISYVDSGRIAISTLDEVRAPLESVLNSLEVVQHLDDSENTMMHNAMEITECGANHSNNTIAVLLNFTRIQGFKLELTDIDNWPGITLFPLKILLITNDDLIKQSNQYNGKPS